MVKSVVICYLILLCDKVLCHGGHEEKGSSAGTSACDDGKTGIEIDLYAEKDWQCHTDYWPVSQWYMENQRCYTLERAYHVCVSDDIDSLYKATIPHSGPHRPVWAQYGEYKYLPPGRYVHNLEHDAVVFMYHPCANPRMVDDLRRTATGCLSRHIITAFPNLTMEYPFAVVTYGCVFRMSKVDPAAIRSWVRGRFGKSPEPDVYGNGKYNYGLINPAPERDNYDYDGESSPFCPDEDLPAPPPPHYTDKAIQNSLEIKTLPEVNQFITDNPVPVSSSIPDHNNIPNAPDVDKTYWDPLRAWPSQANAGTDSLHTTLSYKPIQAENNYNAVTNEIVASQKSNLKSSAVPGVDEIKPDSHGIDTATLLRNSNILMQEPFAETTVSSNHDNIDSKLFNQDIDITTTLTDSMDDNNSHRQASTMPEPTLKYEGVQMEDTSQNLPDTVSTISTPDWHDQQINEDKKPYHYKDEGVQMEYNSQNLPDTVSTIPTPDWHDQEDKKPYHYRDEGVQMEYNSQNLPDTVSTIPTPDWHGQKDKKPYHYKDEDMQNLPDTVSTISTPDWHNQQSNEEISAIADMKPYHYKDTESDTSYEHVDATSASRVFDNLDNKNSADALNFAATPPHDHFLNPQTANSLSIQNGYEATSFQGMIRNNEQAVDVHDLDTSDSRNIDQSSIIAETNQGQDDIATKSSTESTPVKVLTSERSSLSSVFFMAILLFAAGIAMGCLVIRCCARRSLENLQESKVWRDHDGLGSFNIAAIVRKRPHFSRRGVSYDSYQKLENGFSDDDNFA